MTDERQPVASAPGRLPDEGPAEVGGVQLPRGLHVTADASFSRHAVSGPVMWMTDADVDGAGSVWHELVDAFPDTGLWPILLEGLSLDADRPWQSGELEPIDVAEIDTVEVDAVLREAWEEDSDELREGRLPISSSSFPGLVDPSAWPRRDDWLDDLPSQLDDRPIGLVPATRPADILAVIGWTGPANWYDSMAPVSAVLRSWEQRFGTVPVQVGFDTLLLAVRRPPSTIEQALAVTVEHEAFCSDNLWQGIGSYPAYAQELVDLCVWPFWWD